MMPIRPPYTKSKSDSSAPKVDRLTTSKPGSRLLTKKKSDFSSPPLKAAETGYGAARGGASSLTGSTTTSSKASPELPQRLK